MPKPSTHITKHQQEDEALAATIVATIEREFQARGCGQPLRDGNKYLQYSIARSLRLAARMWYESEAKKPRN